MIDLYHVQFQVVVEGISDEAVARRLLQEVGVRTEPIIHIKGGKQKIKSKIRAYNHAASFEPWFILIDLDNIQSCAPVTVQEWLPSPNKLMCFRIAVPQMEAWLLADREGIARYLNVSVDLLPIYPESIQNAKDEMLRLANQSRSREIREDMVYVEGVALKRGPAFTSRLRDFSLNYWNVEEASENSDSLSRCIKALKELLT